MDFQNLQKNYQNLLNHLEINKYTSSYITRVRQDIEWILNNTNEKWNSYVDIYYDIISKSNSKNHQRNQRVALRAIERFDLYGIYPDRTKTGGLIKRAAYYKLCPEFKQLMDVYLETEKKRGVLKINTILHNISATSSLLYHIQKRGVHALKNISEDDVLSFFTDEHKNIVISGNYRKQISYVFKAKLNWKEKECHRILSYFPCIRPKRKNIQYLSKQELEKIHHLLDDDCTTLSLRNKAIGRILFFTGMRACDIANLQFSSINWNTEEIYIIQQKTEKILSLPLRPVIGNAIYDYITQERPNNNSNYIFLRQVYPYEPISSKDVYNISRKFYNGANIRKEQGDRRGTHLFRFNVATSFLEVGIPRPVISQTLGHTNPHSIEPYLFADFQHLKECALNVEKFPINEEVFSI